MDKWPTYEHRKYAIESCYSAICGSRFKPLVINDAALLIRAKLLDILNSGGFETMPIVKCEKTIINEVLNSQMQYAPVYDNTSITVKFIDPATMREI